MANSNNVATPRLVPDHDDETHDSDSVVPDACNMESNVNTDSNSHSGVSTRFENMGIGRSSNNRNIGGVPTIAVSDLTSSEGAATFTNINDITKVNDGISNTALTTSDIDEYTDDDNNNVDDTADTNNNNEFTRINDILNVTEDNHDISYTVLTTFDIDGSAEDANSMVDDVANTNDIAVSLINAPIPNNQSTIDRVETNAPLDILPTFNCNVSPDMPNIIIIVNRPQTENTNKPFSQAAISPLPSQQGSSPSLLSKQVSSPSSFSQQGPRPSLPNNKRSKLPVPIKQVATPLLAPNEHSSTPPLSNDQGSIPDLHDEQGSTLGPLPDHRTLHTSMIIPQITVYTQACCACPSQLIIQPQILFNMDTCYNCYPQEHSFVPLYIPTSNAPFLPPQYPQYNRAPMPYPQFNRAPLPYPPYNGDPFPYRQFNPQHGEQRMFAPRRDGQSDPRFGPSPPFYRTRTPYMEHWQRISPRPENLHHMQGNFPHSHNNRMPNMGFSGRPTSVPSVRPHFQPRNPNGMLNAPPSWQNNVPQAPIYPPPFYGAHPPVHSMPPPSFYPRQRFPGQFPASMSTQSRFERRPPPGFEIGELESIPELSEAQEVNDIRDQIERKEGQLPLYLRKT